MTEMISVILFWLILLHYALSFSYKFATTKKPHTFIILLHYAISFSYKFATTKNPHTFNIGKFRYSY